MVATTACGDQCLDEAIEATYGDGDLNLLFRIVMQCQIIDDVLDYSQDRSAGLPSFLTACESLPQALELTRLAARGYADDRHVARTADVFPLRAALFLVSTCTELVVSLRRWECRPPGPQPAERTDGSGLPAAEASSSLPGQRGHAKVHREGGLSPAISTERTDECLWFLATTHAKDALELFAIGGRHGQKGHNAHGFRDRGLSSSDRRAEISAAFVWARGAGRRGGQFLPGRVIVVRESGVRASVRLARPDPLDRSPVPEPTSGVYLVRRDGRWCLSFRSDPPR